MSLSAVLEKGRILVREETVMQYEPTIMVHYWPTRFCRRDLDQSCLGEPDRKAGEIEVFKGSGCGHGYSLKFPGCGFWSESPLQGDSKAVRVETMPFPCPKVRKGIETRYRHGTWQKLLKTKGWVAV